MNSVFKYMNEDQIQYDDDSASSNMQDQAKHIRIGT